MDETDKWRIAIHEAGHAVVGRILNMVCGEVTIAPDDESAGHAVTEDPYETAADWRRQGRFRSDSESAILRGRIMAFMAGAEAEKAILGDCPGGDDADRSKAMLMLERLATRLDQPALDRRLRRWTGALCRRHAARIRLLARALMRESILSDDEVRALIGVPKPPDAPEHRRAEHPGSEANVVPSCTKSSAIAAPALGPLAQKWEPSR